MSLARRRVATALVLSVSLALWLAMARSSEQRGAVGSLRDPGSAEAETARPVEQTARPVIARTEPALDTLAERERLRNEQALHASLKHQERTALESSLARALEQSS